jgi:adhesin transport system membrane fusion protein
MNDFSRFNSRLKEPRLPRSSLVAWSLFALLAVFIAWASLFQLDEVTTGSGKVIPSSHEQVIQSLEGGIIHSLMVREGDIVERGQQLAQLTGQKPSRACWRASPSECGAGNGGAPEGRGQRHGADVSRGTG